MVDIFKSLTVCLPINIIFAFLIGFSKSQNQFTSLFEHYNKQSEQKITNFDYVGQKKTLLTLDSAKTDRTMG
jgi:hypothetical protein